KADTKANDTKATDTKTASSKKDSAAKDSKNTAAKDDNKTKEADTTSANKTTTAAKKASPTKLSSGQHRVAILGGNRIPFARSNGTYADVSNTDMLTAALDGLVERFNLQDKKEIGRAHV